MTALAELFAVPAASRDAAWTDAFYAAVPDADAAAGRVADGPDGYPYASLRVPGSGSSLRASLDRCLADGTGLVFGNGEDVEWVFHYGNLWSFKEFGTFDAWPRGVAPKASESRQVLTGAPSEALLPEYARVVLRRVLAAEGVEGVEAKVLLVEEPDAAPPRSLMFPVFPDHPRYDAVMRRLTWYLPPHYGLLGGLPSFADSFAPL
jgi:hypothetical protein